MRRRARSLSQTPIFWCSAKPKGVIEDFIEAWSAGADERHLRGAEVYRPTSPRRPMPRFDLLKFEHYLYVGVQFSRGCPFNCEFCDIIELYGRVPRAKTNAQMLAELDALYAAGYRGHVDFVDDNLIGNKKALKRFLPELARLAKGARLSVRVLDRSLDEPRRRSRAAGDDAGGELLRDLRWHRKPRHRNADLDAEEAEHAAQPRRQRAQDLCRRHVW